VTEFACKHVLEHRFDPIWLAQLETQSSPPTSVVRSAPVARSGESERRELQVPVEIVLALRPGDGAERTADRGEVTVRTASSCAKLGSMTPS